MKVLHLGKFYPPVKGGMETILASICDGTSTHVRNRVIVANDCSATVEERRGDVAIVRVAAVAKAGSVALCPAMPLRLRQEEADVIVIHEPNPMGLVSYYLARPAGRLIVWFHSEVVRPNWLYRLFYRPFFEFALSRAAKVVIASPALAGSAPQLTNWQSKCIVIPYGIDVEAEPAEIVRQRAAEIRERHQVPIVLFVGRLVPYKGIEVLLDAMRGVRAVLLIVGAGPLQGSLDARARELGVEPHVRFCGAVSATELEALYLACDIFVLPSVTRQEAFGVVQIEAMARGKPVISTSVGTGVSWVNQHLETGLIVAPGDRAALHDAIQRLIADDAFRAAAGHRAAKRARSVFSHARMIESTVDLFRHVVTDDVEYPPSTLGKRALDLALSAAGLIASAPVWVVLAALIKLHDGGPVFFSQERVGLGGRRFRALKFRSMVANAEHAVGAIQARPDDPRITRIGRVMRATAMDELPQLWNIFRGDMSFVGPRALRPGEIEVNGGGTSERIEDVPGFEARCAVRPGLTGVAQIYAPRDVVRRQKFRYDRVYIRRRSLWLDIRLILLSFWITVRGAWEVRGRKF